MNNQLSQNLSLQRRHRPMLLRYDSVNSKKRYQLIELINEQCFGIKEASQMININYQTAKSILRRFRQTGKIDRVNRILTNNNESSNPEDNDQNQQEDSENQANIQNLEAGIKCTDQYLEHNSEEEEHNSLELHPIPGNNLSHIPLDKANVEIIIRKKKQDKQELANFKAFHDSKLRPNFGINFTTFNDDELILVKNQVQTILDQRARNRILLPQIKDLELIQSSFEIRQQEPLFDFDYYKNKINQKIETVQKDKMSLN